MKNSFDHPPCPLSFGKLRTGSSQEGGRNYIWGCSPDPRQGGLAPCYYRAMHSGLNVSSGQPGLVGVIPNAAKRSEESRASHGC